MIRDKRISKKIAFCLTVVFMLTSAKTDASIYPSDISVTSTLAVRSGFKSNIDSDRIDKFHIKANFMYLYSEDPGFLLSQNSAVVEKDGVCVTYDLPAESIQVGEGNDITLGVVKCEKQSKMFYLLFLAGKDSQISLGVLTEEEYHQELSVNFNNNKLPAANYKDLIKKWDTDIFRYGFLAETSASVLFINEFLSAISARRSQELFNSLVSARRILFSDHPRLSSDNAISVKYNESSAIVGRSILETFFSKHTILDKHQVEELLYGFDEFCKDRSVFIEKDLSGAFTDIVGQIETGSAASFNEGGLTFNGTAYDFFPDIRDVSMEDCVESGVVDDIEKVFKSAANTLRKISNRGKPLKQRKYRLKGLPGYREKLVIERISDNVFPTAEARPDGTIAVNENFVKVMYLLADSGLRSNEFNFENILSNNYSFLQGAMDHFHIKGNVYYSILYAIALHELVGHFKVIDGVVIYMPGDEFMSQSVRGDKTRYINLIAITFFWMTVMEAGGRKINQRNVCRFFEVNPQLVRGFTPETIEAITEAVINISVSLNSRMYFQRIPKEEMSSVLSKPKDGKKALTIEDVTWRDIVDALEIILLKADLMEVNLDSIAKLFGSKYGYFKSEIDEKFSLFCLDRLVEMGLVEKQYVGSDQRKKVENPTYSASSKIGLYDIPLISEVRKFLLSQKQPPYLTNIKSLKAEADALLPLKDPPDKYYPRFIDKNRVLWKDASAVLRYVFRLNEDVFSEDQICEYFPNLNAMQVKNYLTVLSDSGFIRKRINPETKNPFYSRYQTDFYVQTALLELLGKKEDLYKDTNVEDMRAEARAILYSYYSWWEILDLVEFIIMINRADTVLASEGLDPGKVHSIDEIRSFLYGLKQKYREKFQNPDDVDLSKVLSDKYSFDNFLMVRMFQKRLKDLEFRGQNSELFHMDPDSFLACIEDLKRGIEKENSFRLDAKYLYKLPVVSSPDRVKMSFDVLSGIGILERNIRMNTFTLAPYVSTEMIEEIKGPLKNVIRERVDVNSFPVIRAFLLNYVKPDWKMVSSVFSRIYESGEKGISRTDLIENNFQALDQSNKVAAIYDCLYILENIGLANVEMKGVSRIYKPISLDGRGHSEAAQYLSNMDKPINFTGLAEIKKEMFLNHLSISTTGAYYVYSEIKDMIFGDTPVVVDGNYRKLGKVNVYVKLKGMKLYNLHLYLDFLEKAGLVESSSEKNEEKTIGKEYIFIPHNGKIPFIEDILLEEFKPLFMVEKGEVLARIMKRTEPVWSWELKRRLDQALSTGYNGKTRKIVIAVDMDWIPRTQRPFIQSILRRIAEKDQIIVIRRGGADLLFDIEKAVRKQSLEWADVLILGGIGNVSTPDFWRAKDDLDPERESFVAAVDNRDIEEMTYIGLLQMLTMALSQRQLKSLGKHPTLSYSEFEISHNSDFGYFIYYQLPKASEIELRFLKQIYELQILALKHA